MVVNSHLASKGYLGKTEERCIYVCVYICAVHIYVLCLGTQLCSTLCNPMAVAHQAPLSMGDSPGKNTGVGCHALEGIFPTQEWNWGLLHCRWILYLLSYLGSPCVCVLFIYLLSIIDLVLVSHVQQSDSVLSFSLPLSVYIHTDTYI